MRLRILTFWVVAAATSAFAVTPQEAADAILSRNGDYLEAILSKESGNLEADALGNVPDPEIEGAYKIGPAGEDNRWDVGVAYSMEWPGVYGARRRMGNALRKANEAELTAVAAAKRIDILQTIEDYLLADRKLALVRTMANATDSLLLVAESAVRGGEMSRLDLAKISLEQGKMRTLLASAINEKTEAEGVLTTLNGGYDCRALLESIDRNTVRVPLLPESVYLEGVANNPEFLKSVASFESAKSNLMVVKAEGLPSLKIGYSHDFEDGLHFNGANLGMSIPLFSNKGKSRAANAAVAEAEHKMTLVTDRMESEVRSLYRQVQSLDVALQTPDEVFATTDYAALLFKAFQGGEVSLTEYLQERNWFIESHLEYLELQCLRAKDIHLLQSVASRQIQ